MTSFEEAREEFLLHLRACGRAEATQGQYERHLRLLGLWAAQEGRSGDLACWTSISLTRFLLSPQALTGRLGANRSQSTLNALRGSLRAFFAWAASEGLLERDPARLLRRAQAPPPPPRAIPPADLKRLLGALDGARSWPERRDRTLFRTLAGTGLRIGAALALRVEHVDLADAAIEVTSKGARGRLPISTAVRDLLADWMPEDGWVFTSRSGARLSARQAQMRLRSWCRRAGIRPASPHQLRHSHAIALVERGVGVDVVQALLLHRTVASTMTYVRASEARLRAALQTGPEAPPSS